MTTELARRPIAAWSLVILGELTLGLPLVVVGFFFARIALRSQGLVHLLFPAITLVAVALGYWQGRVSRLPWWLLVVLLDLPLAAVIAYFLSDRLPLLPLIPLAAVTMVALGVALARSSLSGVRRATAIACCTLVVNVLLLFVVPTFVGSFVAARRVDVPLPAFHLALLDGHELSSADLRGRVVVVDFWATWCIPCRRELPELDEVRRRFAGRPDVAFYAVDVARGDTGEEGGDSPAQARSFLRAGHYGLTGAYDGAGEARRALGVGRLPALFVLDRAGRLRLRHEGFVGAEDLTSSLTGVIEGLLAETPPAQRR